MINAMLAVALFSAAATPQFQAIASTADDAAPVARVTLHDLDLAHESDRRTLDRRIATAIDKLCPAVPPTGQLLRSLASERCRYEARAQFDLQRTRAVARATAPLRTADSR